MVPPTMDMAASTKSVAVAMASDFGLLQTRAAIDSAIGLRAAIRLVERYCCNLGSTSTPPG